MDEKNIQMLKTIEGLLKRVKTETLIYGENKITSVEVEKVAALTHAREWLLMAADAGREAQSFEKAVERSRCTITTHDCLRMRDQKLDLAKLSLSRAVNYYAEYQKLMHNDVVADVLDMLVA